MALPLRMNGTLVHSAGMSKGMQCRLLRVLRVGGCLYVCVSVALAWCIIRQSWVTISQAMVLDHQSMDDTSSINGVGPSGNGWRPSFIVGDHHSLIDGPSRDG